MTSDNELAKIIWDYMILGQTAHPVDIIICFGSQNLGVADYAAKLYKQGLAPRVLFSGGLGRETKKRLEKPEAELMAERAKQAGVPESDILIENKSANTGDNITFSYELLKAKKMLPKSVILIHKPYMERRILATFEALWPQPQPSCTVSSEGISFEDYCKQRSKEVVITSMVGDLQRLREYPKRGFMTEQLVPDNVWSAFEQLVARGYDKQLIPE